MQVNSCGQSFANHLLSLLSITLSQGNKPYFKFFFFFPNSLGAFYLFNTPFQETLDKSNLNFFIKEKKKQRRYEKEKKALKKNMSKNHTSITLK